MQTGAVVLKMWTIGCPILLVKKIGLLTLAVDGATLFY